MGLMVILISLLTQTMMKMDLINKKNTFNDLNFKMVISGSKYYSAKTFIIKLKGD